MKTLSAETLALIAAPFVANGMSEAKAVLKARSLLSECEMEVERDRQIRKRIAESAKELWEPIPFDQFLRHFIPGKPGDALAKFRNFLKWRERRTYEITKPQRNGQSDREWAEDIRDYEERARLQRQKMQGHAFEKRIIDGVERQILRFKSGGVSLEELSGIQPQFTDWWRAELSSTRSAIGAKGAMVKKAKKNR